MAAERFVRSWPLRLLVVAALALGCEQALGIKDAQLDPLLGAGGGATPSCDELCDTALEQCTAEHAVYANLETCLGICEHLPEGEPGDTDGNSVQCRVTQAQNAGATSEPAVHCPLAAPGGNGGCGSNCESYCLLFEQICAEQFGAAYQSLEDCNTRCPAEIQDLGDYNTGMDEGPTLQCRLYHLAAAAVDPTHHCMHAAGQSPCN